MLLVLGFPPRSDRLARFRFAEWRLWKVRPQSPCLIIDLCDGLKLLQPRQRPWLKNLDEFYLVKLHAKSGNRKSRRRTTAMKKHNHSSDDRPIQSRGKYSRHSRGQALTNFASDRHTGATCLKP